MENVRKLGKKYKKTTGNGKKVMEKIYGIVSLHSRKDEENRMKFKKNSENYLEISGEFQVRPLEVKKFSERLQ